MATAIESAREAIISALETALPAAGIRADDTCTIKRLRNSGNPLSMDPDDAPSQMATDSIVVKVPEIKQYPGVSYMAIANAMAGGNLKVGDMKRVKFVRYAAIEAFLSSVKIDLSAANNQADGPYPEIEYFTFEINGIDYRPVRWNYDDIFADIWVVKV